MKLTEAYQIYAKCVDIALRLYGIENPWTQSLMEKQGGISMSRVSLENSSKSNSSDIPSFVTGLSPPQTQGRHHSIQKTPPVPQSLAQSQKRGNGTRKQGEARKRSAERQTHQYNRRDYDDDPTRCLLL
eukprot:CAMPEP_0173140566 /NCGR_PEP_ID=MMETSP1105-20130129/4971_1 /TAXON_ID=2985 /ORGANISM="Ochromonas sp., Strain BG-1" /LENGTH=128 /DNA_ID=CAMNT_0014053595 /DNA_START=861 /DNA_END=1247 /DNA_ORIENTATION=+